MKVYRRIASGALAFLISSVIAASAYDVWTTGSNGSGQLGLGDNTDRSVFTRVPRRHDAIEVACGSSHMLLRDAEGRLFVCGDNENGQLGIYAPNDQSTPVLLPLPSDGTPRRIDAGSAFSIVTRLASICICGDNSYGQLSTGDTNPQTSILGLLIPGFSCRDLALGSYHSLFLMTDGKVRACGLNGSGQLGQGDTTSRSSATEIPTLSDIIHVAAGGHFSIALNAYGRPYVWGSNSHGQLGLSAGTTSRTTPYLFSNPNDIIQVAAGTWHTLLLKNNGTVYASGANSDGQLGLGDNTGRYGFTLIPDLTGVVKIASGGSFSMFLMHDGTLRTCGANAFGQLGLGDTTARNTPTRVPGLHGVIDIAAGYSFAAAVVDRMRKGRNDFDGDGMDDLGVYNPSDGTWYIFASQSQSLEQYSWGWSTVSRLPGDFDGDGASDLVVYDWAQGLWYIRESSTGYMRQEQWGWPGATPVPADYDGDGKTDIAVYGLGDGNWYIKESSTGQLNTRNWGWGGVQPIQP